MAFIVGINVMTDLTCVIFIFTCVTGVRVSLSNHSVLRLQIALCQLLRDMDGILMQKT
jgi:hypothetical protein